ncbi:MAG: hypothetical protein ACXW61_08490 [Gemmatirosa sp.]
MRPPEHAHAITRAIAVDWSGARQYAERRIWLCEVTTSGVTRLEDGRSREALVAHLCDEAQRDPRLVVGLDFAFSFPDWFVQAHGGDAPSAWRAARGMGEAWLAAHAPPFWGRQHRARRDASLEHFRETERVVGALTHVRPKSVFQVAGAGSVGTGSIRGMPFLLALRDAGFVVWPFDDPRPGAPLALEIWPRLCYGEPVAKARVEARAAWLAQHAPDLAPAHRAAAERSDDAFDALASALALWAARDTLAALPPARDARERREGRIWTPPA